MVYLLYIDNKKSEEYNMKTFNMILKYISLAGMIVLGLLSILASNSSNIVSVIAPTIVCSAIYIGCLIKEKDLK